LQLCSHRNAWANLPPTTNRQLATNRLGPPDTVLAQGQEQAGGLGRAAGPGR
jgi:hypothetical protein